MFATIKIGLQFQTPIPQKNASHVLCEPLLPTHAHFIPF